MCAFEVHDEDNSYDVHYDDGDEETQVKEVLLRKPLARKKTTVTDAAPAEPAAPIAAAAPWPKAAVRAASGPAAARAGRGGKAPGPSKVAVPEESLYMAPSATDVLKKAALTGGETWMSNKEFWAKQDEERRDAAKVQALNALFCFPAHWSMCCSSTMELRIPRLLTRCPFERLFGVHS